MAVVKRRARLSIDVSPEERRRIRLAAAMHDSSIREYVLEAIQERLARDLETKDREGFLALTAETDPVLAELWDNKKDAAYDQL